MEGTTNCLIFKGLGLQSLVEVSSAGTASNSFRKFNVHGSWTMFLIELDY